MPQQVVLLEHHMSIGKLALWLEEFVKPFRLTDTTLNRHHIDALVSLPCDEGVHVLVVYHNVVLEPA